MREGRRPNTTYIPGKKLPLISFVYVTPTADGREVGLGHEPPYQQMSHLGDKLDDGDTIALIEALIRTLPEEDRKRYGRG